MDVLCMTPNLDKKGALPFPVMKAIYVSRFALDRGLEKSLAFYATRHGKPPAKFTADYYTWLRGRDLWRKGNRSFRRALQTVETLGLVNKS